MKKYIVANWKMNTTLPEALELAGYLKNIQTEVEVVVCPPFSWLVAVSEELRGTQVSIGAQDFYQAENGAFTGETSGKMIAPYAEYVILGHSERRANFNETSEQVSEKVKDALSLNLTPIICVGENMQGESEGVIGQLKQSLQSLTLEEINKIIVAYEPVWAIGTGDNASADYVAEVIAGLRQAINDLNGNGTQMPILYGGSVNAQNASEYAANPQINGALVGGASLDAQSFLQIVQDFNAI